MSLLLRNVDIGTRIYEIVRQPARIEQNHKTDAIRKPVEIIVIEDDDHEEIDVMENAKTLSQPKACPTIPEKLLEVLKPHQIHGVEFMFKALTTSPEAHIKIYHGAILAHAQGLGKTLQVVTLAYMLAIHSKSCNNAHAFPKHLNGGSKLRFLVLCPATVVENWANEFTKWLPVEAREYIRTCFYMLGGKASIDSCRRWFIAGGVMIMGYEMFRSFTTSPDAKYAEWKHCLLRADVVVCDEAHRLKNQSSELYDAVEKIKTPARICLTGTPLQNNLEEYYCMINFVYPGYLYDLNDYRMRFAKPIMAGMDLDSSSSQIKLSRRKLYSLQKIIDPLVFRISIPSLSAEMDRCSVSAVYESLMSSTKTEFVVKCKVLDFQKQLYVTCLTELYGLKMCADGKFVADSARKRNSLGKDLLACFYELMTIVNHPFIALKHFERRKEKTLMKKEKKDAVAILEAASEDAVSKEVADTTDEAEEEPDPLPIQLNLFKKIESMYEKLTIPSDDVAFSTKAAVSLKICRLSFSLHEKVLLFSRSLLTLDFMQKILEKNNLKHYRLDGSVAALVICFCFY
jgi:SNF2 family DNA or RNA helicase